ncbi:uncharacterized protein F5147DRAFT_718453 [Suillus discolor]|uniref:Uncharacterized protein n=1 Tax=Suillus discolor TaxID=1912936 RepID=A0A9P7JPF8_9AGAM|nr:uncharacterized protein F5147DRAFT_718453 [Suillus discolor]KAG2095466.1 hypothetical protein F5147DRAFT_718453 [Suillus discolor]
MPLHEGTTMYARISKNIQHIKSRTMRFSSAIVLVVVATLVSSISAMPLDEGDCPTGGHCKTDADCICPWISCYNNVCQV